MKCIKWQTEITHHPQCILLFFCAASFDVMCLQITQWCYMLLLQILFLSDCDNNEHKTPISNSESPVESPLHSNSCGVHVEFFPCGAFILIIFILFIWTKIHTNSTIGLLIVSHYCMNGLVIGFDLKLQLKRKRKRGLKVDLSRISVCSLLQVPPTLWLYINLPTSSYTVFFPQVKWHFSDILAFIFSKSLEGKINFEE